MEDGTCFSLSRYWVYGNDKKVSVRQRETVFGKLTLGLRNHLANLDLTTSLNPGH